MQASSREFPAYMGTLFVSELAGYWAMQYDLITVDLWMQGDDLLVRSVDDEQELLVLQADIRGFLADLVECDRTSLESRLLVRSQIKCNLWHQWLGY